MSIAGQTCGVGSAELIAVADKTLPACLPPLTTNSRKSCFRADEGRPTDGERRKKKSKEQQKKRSESDGSYSLPTQLNIRSSNHYNTHGSAR